MDHQKKRMNPGTGTSGRGRGRDSTTDVEQTPGDYRALPRSDSHDETEETTSDIRSQIDRTREDMGETIDAIQDRLSPRNMVAQAAGSMRDATVDKVRGLAQSAQEHLPSWGSQRRRPGSNASDGYSTNGLMETIRENPLPAALAAASIAWLAVRIRRAPRPRTSDRAIHGSSQGSDAYAHEARIDVHVDPTQGAHSLSGSESGNWGRATGSHRGTAEQVREVKRRARRLTDQNPLAAGAMAAAVGVAIGLTIPETAREDELMGEARDALVERGRQTVRDAAGRVQDAAAEVQRVAGDALTRTEPDPIAK